MRDKCVYCRAQQEEGANSYFLRATIVYNVQGIKLLIRAANKLRSVSLRITPTDYVLASLRRHVRS